MKRFLALMMVILGFTITTHAQLGPGLCCATGPTDLQIENPNPWFTPSDVIFPVFFPSLPTAGDVFTVQINIYSTVAITTPSFNIKMRTQLNGVDTDDITATVSGFNGQQNYKSATISFVIPPNYSGKLMTIDFIELDVNNSVSESNESNNITYTGQLGYPSYQIQ